LPRARKKTKPKAARNKGGRPPGRKNNRTIALGFGFTNLIPVERVLKAFKVLIEDPKADGHASAVEHAMSLYGLGKKTVIEELGGKVVHHHEFTFVRPGDRDDEE